MFATWIISTGKWVIRLVGGWLPIGTKGLPEWAGKILWVVGIIIAVNFVSDLIRPKPANTSRPSVVALPFSKVENVNQSTVQKSEETKRKWFVPIPFVQVAGGQMFYAGGQTQTGGEVTAGIRWDF